MNKVLDQKVKLYILACIDGEAYGEDPQTIEEKVEFLKRTFEDEKGHWRSAQIGRKAALEEWYRGLTTACPVAFMDHEIISISKEWGSLPQNATEREENKILDNWWNLIANKTCQLFDGHMLPKTEDKV